MVSRSLHAFRFARPLGSQGGGTPTESVDSRIDIEAFLITRVRILTFDCWHRLHRYQTALPIQLSTAHVALPSLEPFRAGVAARTSN